MDPVEGIQYVGADKARPNPEAINAIHDSDMVILAPGNPLTSIGPMLQLKGIRKELSKMKKKVVAVSPLIGDNSISGPAAKYMQSSRNRIKRIWISKNVFRCMFKCCCRYKR